MSYPSTHLHSVDLLFLNDCWLKFGITERSLSFPASPYQIPAETERIREALVHAHRQVPMFAWQPMPRLPFLVCRACHSDGMGKEMQHSVNIPILHNPIQQCNIMNSPVLPHDFPKLYRTISSPTQQWKHAICWN
jgi:hypothetical protein